MRRFFVLSFLAAAAALGIWYGVRSVWQRPASSASVTALLPESTLALFYLPDFKRSRAQWHETDLYKLWSEPAVQEFLRKPLARSAESQTTRQGMHQMDALEMRDAFLALTAIVNDRPSVIGGFRFRGSVADAKKVIAPWRARLQKKMPDANLETITYEGHRIEMLGKDAMTTATVYAGNWFFVSNDLTSVKAVLDRLDQRAQDKSTTLLADENFNVAAQQMPADYAAFGYARLDQYMQALAARRSPAPGTGAEASALRAVKSVAAATLFRDGKIRDLLFVTMPKSEGDEALDRSSLALATSASFLYLASVFQLPSALVPPDSASTAGNGVPAIFGRLLAAGTAAGLTQTTWQEAFGQELGVIGDWPAESRLPALFATFTVKDAAKARQIVESLTVSSPSATGWTQVERDGVQYYSQPAPNPMLPLAPTIGLSPKLLVAGLEMGSVERALQRGDSANEAPLAKASPYQTAADWVPHPQQSFTYLDTALLYQRLDAALRPMLIMAAAFLPSVAESVDLGKLPDAEVILKHLSPLVISQRYQGHGYLLESVGPFSIFQAAAGSVMLNGDGWKFLQSRMQPVAAEPTPSPSPDATLASPSPAGI